MATDKQIAANQRNSMRSTGPVTESGKSRSRLNATRHGLASELADVEPGFSPEFEDRRAKWGANLNPVGEDGEWALDRTVAASFRIERCEHAINDHITTFQNRAKLTWDEDRAVEAATLCERLAKTPILVSRQLQTTLAGVVLLMEAWMLLVGALEPGQDWSESERSRALDLLGVDPDLRNGRMRIDAPEGANSADFRRSLALDELDRLEALHDQAMVPLDEMERRHAMKGDVALLTKEAKLLLRYEREAWKHYNQSMKQVKNPSTVMVSPSDAPAQPSVEEKRSVLISEAAPITKQAEEPLIATGFTDEDAMLDEFERRLGLVDAGSPYAPERSQFANFAVGRSS